MDLTRTFFTFCLMVLYFNHACWSELLTPRNLKVQSSVLIWSYSAKDTDSILFTVEYNRSSGDWHRVCNCSQSKFNFTEDAEKFYGKHFRVRAEKANQTSDWLVSGKVQCVHIDACVPQIKVKVEPDTVRLWMTHRDPSVTYKNGRHISFRPVYWERSSPDHKQELVIDPEDNTLVRSDLESWQEYCFQAEYLLYHKPYGKHSKEICKEIPETSKMRKLRIILWGVVPVVALALLLGSLFLLYEHKKRIKSLLQPPLVIPNHFEEFLLQDSNQLSDARPLSQMLETFDILNVEEAEESRCDVNESSSTSCET